jgi:hypothetical protein
MIRTLGVAAVLLVARLLSQDAAARLCHFPAQPLASKRDTAAWCARDFLVRNGYTERPASAERADIALEPTMDVGNGLAEVLGNRRNTISATPELVCATSTGFLVSFTMPNQVDQTFDRGVTMTNGYVGITLLQPWVRRSTSVPPACSVPRLPMGGG